MIVPSPQVRWRPAVVALVLGFAALLRTLPMPVQAQTALDVGAALAEHVLCLGDASSADAPGPAAPSHEECQACCLPAGRLALAQPAIVPSAPQPVPRATEARPVVWPGIVARAPPFEAWSEERAQRGPPTALIA